jgi:protoheme ferro-lyase
MRRIKSFKSVQAKPNTLNIVKSNIENISKITNTEYGAASKDKIAELLTLNLKNQTFQIAKILRLIAQMIPTAMDAFKEISLTNIVCFPLYNYSRVQVCKPLINGNLFLIYITCS